MLQNHTSVLLVWVEEAWMVQVVALAIVVAVVVVAPCLRVEMLPLRMVCELRLELLK